MIKIITNKNIKMNYSKQMFNYIDYCKWLDEEKSNLNYWGISTTNYEIRDAKDWNSKGREIYDKSKTIIHVKKIISILNNINVKKFFIQHSYKMSKWFPDFILNNGKSTEKINFIQKYQLAMNIKDFSGGFYIENDIDKFLTIFIDYPFSFNYKDIDCICVDINLLLSITHHLSIDFVSNEEEKIEIIKKLCDKEDLHYISYVQNK